MDLARDGQCSDVPRRANGGLVVHDHCPASRCSACTRFVDIVEIIGLFGLVILASLLVAPRRATTGGFFGGLDVAGRAPGLWVLVLSQVTTWIFARSLMNSAILGYFYGIWGTLAYAAYYGSFLSGAFIVGRLRAGGARSVQDWLGARFGATGNACYNTVIGLRLLSEVFANLLVVGLIFAAVLPKMGVAREGSILIVAALALAYSAWGGLSAALRTDMLQMVVFWGSLPLPSSR